MFSTDRLAYCNQSKWLGKNKIKWTFENNKLWDLKVATGTPILIYCSNLEENSLSGSVPFWGKHNYRCAQVAPVTVDPTQRHKLYILVNSSLFNFHTHRSEACAEYYTQRRTNSIINFKLYCYTRYFLLTIQLNDKSNVLKNL